MDFSKLTLGSKVVLGAGILLLLDSFIFRWQEVSVGPFSVGNKMWHGWGVLVGLTLLAILAWEVAQLADVKVELPLSPAMVTMLLSALLVLFTLIKVLTDDYVTSWAWIGLVLSIGVGVGAWLNMQSAGESLGDLKSSFGSGGSSAPAAPVAPVAPAEPAAPAAPAEPETQATPEVPTEGGGAAADPTA